MSNLQDNQEEPKIPTPTQRVSFEQTLELLSYPQHWRPTLRAAAERGESIKEAYERLKDFEAFM
jgi:hypothetical protein